MPDQTVHCVVERAAKLSEPTRKTSLHEPLAYDNAYAHSMRYRAFNDDGTEADLTGYSVVGAFTPSGHNTIKPLLNGTVSGNVAELILPSACYKHPGRFKFTMNLNKGSVSRSVLWVEGMVERNQTDTIEAPTEVLDVSQVITDAQTAAAEANAARDRANTLANTLVNNSVNAITAAGTQQRQSVNDLGDQLKDYLEDHYGETTDKVAAKANRSSVSAVKHAIGADGQLTLTDALNEPAKKMTIHLEPKQDLHGYDKPWVGGAGKNLCPTPATNSGTRNGVTYVVNSDGSITLTGTASKATVVSFSKPFMVKSGVTYLLSGCPSNGSVSTYRLDLRTNETTLYRPTGAGEVSDTGTGASFTPSEDATIIVATRVASDYAVPSGGIKFYPMVIPATETDSTYEPYSNICPIEGFDSVEVVSTGKNLFDKNNLDKTTGYLTEPSALISNSANYRVSNWIRVNAGEKYTVSNGTTRGESPSYAWYDENRNPLQVTYHHSGGFPQTYTAPDGAYWLRESVHVSDLDTFMLEKGATASSYEPFGNAISLNLVSSAGSTVYGGTVTVNEDGSGTLTVDRASVTLSGLDTSKVSYSTATKTFYITSNVAPGLAKKDYTAAFTGICDKFEPYPGTPAWSANTKPYIGYGSDLNFRFAIPGKTEVADVLDVLNGTTVTYYLATPTTYTLTAAQLRTLLGTNHVWTDGTNIDLDYYSDRYAEIDKLYAAFPKDIAAGNPATFTDGADGLLLEKLEVAIEPKQDLHGYDHPWVGGAGKNLYSGKIGRDVFANNASATHTTDSDVMTVVMTDDISSGIYSGTSSIIRQLIGTLNGNYTISMDVRSNKVQNDILFGVQNTKTTVVAVTTAWTRINFTGAFNGVANPLVLYNNHGGTGTGCTLTIRNLMVEAGTTASAYEPYENICPISGFDELTVTNFGANILDISDSSKDFITILPAGTYTLKRFNSSSDTKINSRIELLINNSYQYIISGEYDDGNVKVISGDLGWGTAPSQIIITKKEYTLRFLGSTKNSLTFHNATLMMVPGTTVPTSYEPYNGSTILPISLRSISGSTVYGGKLTVNRDGTGELVVDRAIKTLTAADMASLSDSGKSTQMCCVTATGAGTYTTNPDGVISSHFKSVSWSQSPWNVDMSISPYTANLVRIKDTNLSTLQDYKNFVMDNNVQISYQLLTPTTYSLTAPQVTTLIGMNHISCDAGRVTVTYCQDPKLVLENRTDKIMSALTPYVEETMVATRNYIAGEILSVGTNLYKTTIAIANGASLTVGTNVENTTLTTGVANGITINATPASAMSVEGGWVNVTLDKTNAEIIQAASSGKSIIKLQNYGATIICRQAEYTSYAVYFHGVSIDNSLLIYNVMVTSSSAQAALVGSVAMTR